MKSISLHKLMAMAMLTAIALTIFMIEAQIPLPIPIPGIKLGLANIITVYAVFVLGPREALLILLCRILLGAMFAGQVMSLLYSLAGGCMSLVVMIGLSHFLTKEQIWIAGIIGAMAHNIGQMAIAVAVTRTPALAVYLPFLLIAGSIAGSFTGLCSQVSIRHLEKLPWAQGE